MIYTYVVATIYPIMILTFVYTLINHSNYYYGYVFPYKVPCSSSHFLNLYPFFEA